MTSLYATFFVGVERLLRAKFTVVCFPAAMTCQNLQDQQIVDRTPRLEDIRTAS